MAIKMPRKYMKIIETVVIHKHNQIPLIELIAVKLDRKLEMVESKTETKLKDSDWDHGRCKLLHLVS